MNQLKKLFFTLLPRTLMSRGFGFLATLELPVFSTAFRDVFIKIFQIDTHEAEKPLKAYPTVQAFFTRRLKEGARPIAEEASIVSPVDGKLSQWGRLDDEHLQMMQAKGRFYSLRSLVPVDSLWKDYQGGAWATIYLAPYNYHRIHSPIAGKITRSWYVPGTLWPVNEWSVNNVADLFCVNERLITEIENDFGKILVVKVGATNVGRISLAYTDDIVTNTHKVPEVDGDCAEWISESSITLKQGDELGCFELGSTVILIASAGLIANEKHFDELLGQAVQMGQAL
jgi:phosphatidylserine decarboxylase